MAASVTLPPPGPEHHPVDRTDYGTASGSARGFAQSTTRNSSRAPPSVATRKTSTTLLATCVSRTHS